MIIRRFMLWARTASAADRAAGIGALAQAWRYSDLTPDERRDAETAMLALLDDPAPQVRRAMAEALAGSDGPRAVLLGLAQDQAEIAAIILGTAEGLSEDDLVDAVAVGGEPQQCAVAGRRDIGIAVSAALVEVGCEAAVITLLQNPDAELVEQTLERAAERFGHSGLARDALLARPDLPVALRHDLAVQVAEALKAWAGSAGLLPKERAERIARESAEKVAVALAAEGARAPQLGHELTALVRKLRATGG